MDQRQIHFRHLLNKYLSNNISEGEVRELFNFIKNEPGEADEVLGGDNRLAFEEKLHNFTTLQGDTSEKMKARLLEAINVPGERATRIVSLKRLFAAASILLLVGLGTYFMFFNRSQSTPNGQTASVAKAEVEAPKSNRATITLANGEKVFVESANSGTLALQGGVKVIKTANGEIAYQALADEESNETTFNTLDNPKGSTTIDMTFSDGTRVWLNAGSSITYPVKFTPRERRVSIDGEVYFEVAHDQKRPFYVAKQNVTVEVLGTHFNVQAYDNEKSVQVTLLEGSVRVAKNGQTAVIKPGEQAELTNQVKINRKVNVQNVMAWKNGLFRFDNTPLDKVLRQVERWYDVKVFYESRIPSIELGGEIKRDLTLAQLLEGLGELGVKFEIKNKQVYVKN